MLYSEIKRATLSHIMQYSIAGAQIATSYNNQADYVNRIPGLINEGLVNILTSVKRSATTFPLTEGEEVGGFMRYTLPDNIYALKSGGVVRLRNGKLERTNDFMLQDKRAILVPKEPEARYMVEYYRYPGQLPSTPEDSFNLEEDLEVIQAATYYAAANLVMLEDEFAYSALYNDYESRLSRMTPGITVETSPINDVYNFSLGVE